jgi:hypothetical protein
MAIRGLYPPYETPGFRSMAITYIGWSRRPYHDRISFRTFIPQNLANTFASTHLPYPSAMYVIWVFFKYDAGISPKPCYSLCIHGQGCPSILQIAIGRG